MSASAGDPSEGGGQFLQDWITVWQSELAALRTDREARENWRAAVGMMAIAMQAMAPLIERACVGLAAAADEPASGRAGSAAAPGPAPVADAPDAGQSSGGDELAQLARRVAELERRLAARRAPGADADDAGEDGAAEG